MSRIGSPCPVRGEKFLVVSLSPCHERGEQVAFALGIAFHDEVHYLCIGVPDHLLSRGRGVRLGCPGVQEPEKVVDFRDRADRRTRVVPCCLLLDGDDRAESLDALDFGLFKNSHEVLGIRRQRVHVPALAFGVYGVEGEGGLAAPAESGDDHEPVARDVE